MPFGGVRQVCLSVVTVYNGLQQSVPMAILLVNGLSVPAPVGVRRGTASVYTVQQVCTAGLRSSGGQGLTYSRCTAKLAERTD